MGIIQDRIWVHIDHVYVHYPDTEDRTLAFYLIRRENLFLSFTVSCYYDFSIIHCQFATCYFFCGS